MGVFASSHHHIIKLHMAGSRHLLSSHVVRVLVGLVHNLLPQQLLNDVLDGDDADGVARCAVLGGRFWEGALQEDILRQLASASL